MNSIKINGRTIRINRFKSLELATFCAHRRGESIILGDCDSPTPYWLATRADGERLHRAGYEYAHVI